MVNSLIDQKLRIYLVGFAFFLFSIIVIGIFIFLTDPAQAAGFTFSYIAGLSMIFLPCTLPLAFIIVPIAMNESPKKGMVMALLFGAGMMITFSIYGVAFASIGEITGLLTANVIAGILGGGMAYIFGLSEVGLIKMKIPGIETALPGFIQRQGDYIKVFLLGLLLANVGVGCPNPAFYVLLAYVIGTADIFTGWSIMAVHGIGRATPLIFLVILGILGINATQGITKRIGSVRKVTGWGLIFVGAILFTITGLFRDWYEESVFHESWNHVLIALSGGRIGEAEELSMEKSIILETVPQWLGPYVLILLLAIPVIWYFYKKQKKGTEKEDTEKEVM
ncbi:MAG: cytochrome C biogenesis protein [Candidatus Methanoperedenaceae archaeon]|nr:cytochrome C biogenesis protein [Candidatus Methanoperedenaceae archaeon]